MRFLRSPRFWIGITISLVCLWLALKDIPLNKLGNSLVGAVYIWFVPAVICQILAVVARSQRWAVLLKKPKEFTSSFWAQGFGYLFTNIFPFRLGEPARVIVMAQRCELPIVYVAGTAIIERLLDVSTIIVGLIFILPWMRVPSVIARTGVIFGFIILIAIIAIIVLSHFRSLAKTIITGLCKWFKFLPEEALQAHWAELIGSLALLTETSMVIKVVFWSLISWSFSGLVYWCVIRAFQPDSLPIEALFMMISLSLAVTVPSSPGFIGVFQLVGQQALVLPFGNKYNISTALAITLAAYLIYYFFTTLLGLLAVWKTGVSFSLLIQQVTGKKPKSIKSDPSPIEG